MLLNILKIIGHSRVQIPNSQFEELFCPNKTYLPYNNNTNIRNENKIQLEPYLSERYDLHINPTKCSLSPPE